jgi:hypothetical protein
LKYTGLESLDDKLLQGSGSLSDAEVDDLLLNNGLDRSESNRADLRNWQSFYQELNASEDIDDLRRPFMTFNDLFTAHLNHVSATSKP